MLPRSLRRLQRWRSLRRRLKPGRRVRSAATPATKPYLWSGLSKYPSHWLLPVLLREGCSDLVGQQGHSQPQEGSRARQTDRAAQVVALRNDGLLLWEIATRLGVTKERVRQILAKASSMGVGPSSPKQVGTRRAAILLGMSPEMRPGSFKKLMAKFGVAPVASKRGRLYWSVQSLVSISPPNCVVCGSPVPLGRYARSVTCSRHCSAYRRSQYSSRRKEAVASVTGSKAG